MDGKNKTSYREIIAIFSLTIVSSITRKHPEIYENRYYRYLEYILELDLKSFKVVLFKVCW
jgi:hypothetical protein